MDPKDTKALLSDNTSTEGDNSKDIDYAALARPMGWRDESSFKGDPAKFVDAKTYYDRAQTVLPIVKHENDALRAELVRVKESVKPLIENIERAHAKELEDLKAQLVAAKEERKEAIKDGDGEAFDAADTSVRVIEAKIAKGVATPPSKTPPVDPVFEQWASENKWLVDNEEYTAIAAAIGGTKFKHLHNKGREFYDAVANEVKAIVAARDGNGDGRDRPGPARPRHGSGDRQGAPKRSYENLLPDYKSTCDRQFKDFGVKDQAKWRERYVNGCTDDAFRS